RAEVLADQALQIWPAPTLPEETLAKYRKTRPGTAYTLADHPGLDGPLRTVFEELRKRIQNLDAGVIEEVRKQYIAYRFSSNFVEVVPQVNELKLYLDIPFVELVDPMGLGRDVSKVGHWGTGGVETRLATVEELEAVMALVRQSFAQQAD